MKFFIGLVVGGGIGYVLGIVVGCECFDEIVVSLEGVFGEDMM